MAESDEPGTVPPTAGGQERADGAPHLSGLPGPTSSGGARAGAPGTPALTAFASEVGDRLVEAVAWAKAKATVKLVTALRAVVYGLVILAALLTAMVLATVGLVRVWDAYVPVFPLATRVWLGYVVFGAAFFAPGLWLVGKRRGSGPA